MILPGAAGQRARHLLMNASGTITAGGTAQLLLPEAQSRSMFMFTNLSGHNMYLEFGSARATATITSGAVTSVSIANGGFGFTYPPDVEFLGGGNSGNSAVRGVGQWGYPSPGDPFYQQSPRVVDLSSQRPARGTATLSAGAVNAVSLIDGGGGYNVAPYIFIRNSARDPYGCATPSVTSGVLCQANGGGLYLNGPVCPTDPIAVYGSTTSDPFYCVWMP